MSTIKKGTLIKPWNRKGKWYRPGNVSGSSSSTILPAMILRFASRMAWCSFELGSPKGPHIIQDRRLAVQVEDHPLEYRNFRVQYPRVSMAEGGYALG